MTGFTLHPAHAPRRTDNGPTGYSGNSQFQQSRLTTLRGRNGEGDGTGKRTRLNGGQSFDRILINHAVCHRQRLTDRGCCAEPPCCPAAADDPGLGTVSCGGGRPFTARRPCLVPDTSTSARRPVSTEKVGPCSAALFVVRVENSDRVAPC